MDPYTYGFRYHTSTYYYIMRLNTVGIWSDIGTANSESNARLIVDTLNASRLRTEAIDNLVDENDKLKEVNEELRERIVRSFNAPQYWEDMLPALIRDVLAGLKMGPPPADHPTDNCEDCVWYDESVQWKNRILSGEFGSAAIGLLEYHKDE